MNPPTWVADNPHDWPRGFVLSVRAWNGLRRAGVKTIEDLTQRSCGDLLRIRDLGKKTLFEIREQMGKHGLALRGDIVAPISETEKDTMSPREEVRRDAEGQEAAQAEVLGGAGPGPAETLETLARELGVWCSREGCDGQWHTALCVNGREPRLVRRVRGLRVEWMRARLREAAGPSMVIRELTPEAIAAMQRMPAGGATYLHTHPCPRWCCRLRRWLGRG